MEYGFKTLESVLLTALRSKEYFNPHDVQEIIEVAENGLDRELVEEIYELHNKQWSM